eukprot:7370927-Pyramimonas_sp.AAC.2
MNVMNEYHTGGDENEHHTWMSVTGCPLRALAMARSCWRFRPSERSEGSCERERERLPRLLLSRGRSLD